MSINYNFDMYVNHTKIFSVVESILINLVSVVRFKQPKLQPFQIGCLKSANQQPKTTVLLRLLHPNNRKYCFSV